MSCEFHDRTTVGEPTPCALQRLADHTITVTEARAPRVALLVLLVDLDDSSHTALGSNIRPALAARLLEKYARDLRR